MLGPPMSMFSIASSKRDARLLNGLLERVKIDADQVDRVDAMLLHRRDVLGIIAQGQQRAVDAGCSVFTRPSIISGKPVTCATSVTGNPCSRRNLAVPPVLISSTPNSSCSAVANSASPVLSETESSARLTGTSSVMGAD